MPRIFISYRRADSQAMTGRIYDHLLKAYSEQDVFKDVEDIPLGVNFAQHIAEEIATCDVVLAIIGKKWIDLRDAEGARRLDNPDDFVRLEVVTALNQAHTRVIPVLVDGAVMPTADDLPEPMQPLHYRNAAQVRYDPDFEVDMGRLIEQIGKTKRAFPVGLVIGGAMLLVVALMVLLVALNEDDAATTPPDPRSTILAQQDETESAGGEAEAELIGNSFTIEALTPLLPEPDVENSIGVVRPGNEVTVLEISDDERWLRVELDLFGSQGDGWISNPFLPEAPTIDWTVLFTDTTESDEINRNQVFVDALVGLIDNASERIDMAAFEFESFAITDALINAQARGVQVRLVVDDEHTLEDDFSTIQDVLAAGIEVVDDERSSLMLNNTVIVDDDILWTGRWTFSDDTNIISDAMIFQSPAVVAEFRAEFEEMFVERSFGPTSPRNTINDLRNFGYSAQVYFSPEDDFVGALFNELNEAEESIRFIQFTFTHDATADALIARAADGILVEGIVERRGSETDFSELGKFTCAGLDVMQDGYGGSLYQSLIIIDDETIITGSYNLSQSNLESNDTHVLFIDDPDMVALFLEQYLTHRANGQYPDPGTFDCS